MPITYPGTIDIFTNPTGADNLSSPDHAIQHSDVNDAVEAIEAVVGTTAGTSVLKNFAAGDFPARINSSSVLQHALNGTINVMSGTINNSLIGTLNGVVLGTPSVTGGTINNAVVGTSSITGGTVNNVVIGTASLIGGTLDSAYINAKAADEGASGFSMDMANGATITIANNGTAYPFGTTGNFAGLVIINDYTQTGETGLFLTSGLKTVLVSQTNTVYSGSAATAGKINLFLSGGANAVTVENKQGNQISFRVFSIRMRSTT